MATTDIVPFATGSGANVEAQASYAADSTTATGFVSGILPSNKLNKPLRQASFIAAGLANFMVNLGISVPDDGNLTNLVSGIAAAITLGASNTSIGGGFRNLKIISTSNTSSTITVDEIILEASSGQTVRLTGVNKAYSTAASGVNGLDTGSLASGWLYEYLIYNPATATVNSLLSLNSSAPTLPAGYTFFARVGSIFIDGSSNIMRKIQYGRDAQYIVGTNPATARVMANGVGGNPNPLTPTFVQISMSAFIPPTASKIKVGLEVSGGALVHAIVAPNANYGGITTANVFLAQTNQAVAGSGGGVVAEIIPESQYLYYASDAAASSLQCLGWSENF